MPTAVLDLDLKQLPNTVDGLERYTKALILVRFNGQPLGQVSLTVVDGRLDAVELRNTLIEEAGWNFLEKWVQDYLKWDEVCYNQPLPKATVAICTRDRPDDVKRCLNSLMQMPDDGQEILVIDNCPSNEDTRLVTEQYNRIRYIREVRPGLNIARNRAIREAKYDIVAFTDDDAAPDPNWLRALLYNFSEPLVMCVTGLTMPLELETEAQESFERYSPFGKGFQRRVFDRVSYDPLATGRVGAGANMAVRKGLLDLVGEFDEALDAGTASKSGGDHEMFARILSAGYRIVYDPKALSWHRHRRTWEELRQALYGYGVGVYAMWTRLLLKQGAWGVFRMGWLWLYHDQFPNLVKALLRRPGSLPLDLALAEIQGCFVGSKAYLAACKRLQSSGGTR